MNTDKDARIAEPAIEQYKKFTEGDQIDDPIEALRFFCSLSMKTSQDWFDIEQFFDLVIEQRNNLERKLAEHELFSEFTTATYGVACGSEHASMLNKIIAKSKESLERKLAEQQAILTYLMDRFDNETWQCWCGNTEDTATMDSAIFLREFLKDNSNEELNDLLTKAKEEGRKEAAQDGWQVVPKEPTEEMLKEGADMFEATLHSAADFKHHAYHVFASMIDIAPKPQGETE